MNIVAITTFPNSLIDAKLTPLSRVESVDQITLVCNIDGSAIPKVRYVVPPPWLYRVALHKSVAKFITLFREVRRQKPRMITAYTLFPHGVSAWLVSRILGKPIAVHLTGGYIELTVRKELSDNSLVKALPMFAGAVEALNRWVVKRCDHVMVPGSVTRSFLVEQVGVRNDRIVSLHSTIDVDRFKPSEGAKDFHLILVAKLRGLKRCELFLEAVRLVRERIPAVRAVIVGDGDSLATLRQLANEKSLADHVLFTGFRQDPMEFYRRSSVFLLPSAAEGLSTAVMEGMACGVPAVASDVGDMRDIVIDDVTGYIVPRDAHADEYAAAALRILESPERHTSMSHNCRDLITRERSFAQATGKWEAFLGGE